MNDKALSEQNHNIYPKSFHKYAKVVKQSGRNGYPGSWTHSCAKKAPEVKIVGLRPQQIR